MSQDQLAALILFLPFAIPCAGFALYALIEAFTQRSA